MNICNNFSIFSRRDATKEDVKSFRLMEFESFDGFRISTALYEPEWRDNNIMLYFHGGGFIAGGIESHDCLCRKIANALRVRVMSVEYRLAPEYKFPVALNDALSVYRAIFAEKIDFDNVIIAGDSAGGNLCAALCIKLKEIAFHESPSMQILFYPYLSNDLNSNSFIKFGEEENLTTSMMMHSIYQYTGKDPADEETRNNKLICPLLENDMSVFPKTLIISAEKDILLDGQFLFAQKLRNAGIEVDHTIIEDSKHGFMTYGNEHEKYAKIALDWIRNILRKINRA